MFIFKVKYAFVLLVISCGLSVASTGWSGDSLFTLWPIVDYRSSENTGVFSLNILGPIINVDGEGRDHKFNLRPLYYRGWRDPGDHSYSEFLYPVASKESSSDQSFFQGLRLFSYEIPAGDSDEGGSFQLFPLIFSGTDKEKGRYFAIFPLGGTLYNHFARDEIHFTLFPLYSKTLKKGTTVTNVLWPFFA